MNTNYPLLLSVAFLSYVIASLDVSLVIYGGIICGLCYLLYRLYDFFFEPLNHVTPAQVILPDYLHEVSQSEGSSILYKSRKLGDFPPPYPNGWYVLCYSGDLKNGDIRPINVLGGQYALWRDNKGKAHLFDAYCPHMGANLAMGGKVVGDCLKCPFHGWEFNGDGSCAKVPNTTDKPSKFLKTDTYTILETNCMIHFWYDAENREPYWYPPEFPEINEKKFIYHGRTEHHVMAHLQELPENGADIAHLGNLHNTLHKRSPIIHEWTASWEPIGNPADKEGELTNHTLDAKTNSTLDKIGSHWTKINVKTSLTCFGIPLPFFDVKTNINQIGPGIVWLRFFTPFGEALICGAATPFGPMLQRTYHIIFTPTSVPRFVAKIIVSILGRFYEQDVIVWQWKTYPSKPMLGKDDTNIKKFRKWFSQFYSEHSISFNDAVSSYGKARSAIPIDW